jgi:uncharacterized protein YutE (UPF0331/DUF86 family)
LDKKVIEVRLKKLDHAVSRLKRIQRISKDEYTNNQDYQDIAERNFQVAMQTCIDIANYIIAGQNLLVPDEQENIFVVLGKNGVLPEELIKKIKGMVSFRNILVHNYLYTDPNQVYDILQNQLADFNSFAQAIVNYLEST